MPAVGNGHPEGESQQFTDEDVLLTDAQPRPAHHQLAHHAAVVAALLVLELDGEGVCRQLVESHVEGARPS